MIRYRVLTTWPSGYQATYPQYWQAWEKGYAEMWENWLREKGCQTELVPEEVA